MLHACFTLIDLCFVYTLCHFYAFSETNLLTRCHSAAVFVFKKSYTGNILEIGWNESRSSYLPDTKTESRGEMETDQGPPWSRHQVVWPPGPPPDIALPPINSLRRENPKEMNTFSENILQAAAVVVPRLEGSRSSSRFPTGEGNHHRRPSSSPCQPPEWCMSSLLWTTGP
jgi:hypothetical protein